MSNGEPRWVISGGIGSGKSVVRRLLDDMGFFTIDADSVGHEVLATGGLAYAEVTARWPEAVDEAGEIDRSSLASLVFDDPDQLAELESITHPHIFGIISQRVQGIPDPVAVEIPLLDHRLENHWGRVIVDSDSEERISRMVGRGMPPDDAKARMASQPSRGQWLAVADIVVPNHGDMTQLRSAVSQVVAAH